MSLPRLRRITSSGCLLNLLLFIGYSITLFASRSHAQQSSPPPENFIERYQARVSATQAEQPHWVTPLVTVTPRLEQELRTDFVHQYNPKGFAVWNYGNSKGLEFIPERHTEIIINVPPFFNRSNGEQDGFGDMSFLAKGRLYSRNEEHGNGIVTVFFAATIPTGKNGNGSCCAVVTPTLAVGKGFGRLDLVSTAGGSLPVTNSKGLGHTITWNNTIQYRLASSGLGRFIWPEAEFNSSFYKGGANDGHVSTFGTPGIIFGRVPLSHDASGRPGRLGLTFGAGEQIALTHFHTYNHATVLTLRIPF
ncbi:hypothetical protein ACPOL_1428 [Acidisarcina polymorpha]|uniref:Neuromedin U n=1 Tax=Acidisarcina polymorpha TaxID=2211140 RepID=A0A2Z5FW95_9BACT|nr:hypothetical protein [Acidisarcina polymorpha]AXC10774.1 hypothetical protein ACPOL_1428 [Acidisarcina polymorpha]